MSRGVHNFKQGDAVKAIKAALKAGVRDWRVEIEEGKIVIRASDGRVDPVAAEKSDEWD
jgi:hypothetical protein